MGDGPEPRKWDRARIVGLVVCIIYGLLITVWHATRNGQHDWTGSILLTVAVVAGSVIMVRLNRH